MHDLWRGKYRKVMFTRGKTGDTIFLTVMESQFDEKHTYLMYELKKVKKSRVHIRTKASDPSGRRLTRFLQYEETKGTFVWDIPE